MAEGGTIIINTTQQSNKRLNSTVPPNSISCFIGRICEDPADDFGEKGHLIIDLDNIKSEPENRIKYGEQGSKERLAIASWTLRAAWIAWSKPPMIKFKGKVRLSGKISMSNAQLTQVNISGGPPMMGTVAHPFGPGTSTTPVAISSATGTAKVEQQSGAEIEMETGDDLNIELTSQTGAQLPWCISGKDANEGDETDPEGMFIKAGDLALCLAFGNSINNLYVVDILR